MRKTHNVNELNKHRVFSKCNTIITFRNQQLLDLWENEMSGQISDGMWENSRGTEWIWNAWVKLGNETKVECRYGAPYGAKKSYPLTKELWDVVGDRIMDESGFASKKEAYAAWREIYEAIKNAGRFSAELEADQASAAKVIAAKRKKIAAAMDEEWICAGYKIEEYSYSWSKDKYYRRETIYIREDVKKGYITVDAIVEDDGSKGKWKIGYNDAKYYIPAGHLQEGLAKIRWFYRNWEDWVQQLKNQENL